MSITAASQPTEVEDLGPEAVLAGLGEAEAAERRAGLAKLELAVRWSVLHPATDQTGAAVWGDAGLPGFESEESPGGVGCPAVAGFAPEPFAAALGVSTLAGMQLLAHTLDLAHRLPATWARVRTLAVAPGGPGGWPRPPTTCPPTPPPTSTPRSSTGPTPAARC